MFSNKMNNSGWILCPSKRFPGKFYYYNVLNGESAWSFNDTEKKFLSIDDKTRLITQKWHSYPEPVSPPGKGHNSFTRSGVLFPQQFGQATFQNYISPASKQSNPYVLKKPVFGIQSIKPVFGIQSIKKPEVPKKNIDIQTDLPETEIMVQSCKETLSERFWKYQKYDNDNTTYSEKINWPRISESVEDNSDSSNVNYLESNKKNTTNGFQSNQNVERSHENLFLANPIPVKNKKDTSSQSTDAANKVQLDENDLRYILQAKKSDKKIDKPQNNIIKKVRFDLSSGLSDDNDASDIEDESAIRDAFNTTTAKIIKHIHNTEKCVLQKNQYHVDDDIKNIKFVVKNCNANNLFLQKADSFNPFQLKNDKINKLGKILGNQNVEESLNVSNAIQFPASAPECNDVLNVTKSIKDKLHVSIPTQQQYVDISKILFPKFSVHENPFKKYKSKMNPYLKCISSSRKNLSFPNFFVSNKLKRNTFKVPTINKEVSSNRDVNYFDPKLYRNTSSSTCCNTNTMSSSDYVQTCSQYSNPIVTNDSGIQRNSKSPKSNPKVTEESITFSEKNKNETKDCWLDEMLKNFYTRNTYIEKTIIIRLDEIICSFTQIMEEIIYNILKTSNCPPPYSLYDAILCLQRRFSEHTHILQVIDKITDLDIFCPKTGYLKHNVHPYELIKVLGCGLVFIEALNELHDFDIKHAEDALLRLVRDIEEPQYVELPQPTTTVSRDGSTDQPERVNFIKRRSDILAYLQNHFPEWQNYSEEQDQTPNTNTNATQTKGRNVLVTTGKDLHLFKINNKNEIYCEQEHCERKTNDFECDNIQNDTSKVIRKFHAIEMFENRINDVNAEEMSSNSLVGSKQATNPSKNEEEINDVVCGENKNIGNDEPTPVKNSCKDNTNNISEESVIFIKTETDGNESAAPDSPPVDNTTRINESSTITDDFPVLNNDPVIPYYTHDADQYYLIVKNFLAKLSSMLLSVHSFIKESTERVHSTDLPDDDRKELHEETNQTYITLKNIILDLNSIIERETRDENTLRALLIGADGALEDKRITNYRQVVAKCLEQARLLSGCVRLLLRATDRDCTLSASSDAGDDTCINIFE